MRVLPLTRPLLLAGLALLAVAVPGAAAAATCPSASDLQQPFVPFGDPASYFLAPGAAFETRPWSGGRIVSGNEPWRVRRGGQRDSRALAVGTAGATSPETCIGLQDPTIRFFAVRTDGPDTASLAVSVTFTGTDGRQDTLPLAPVTAPFTWSWVVTIPIPILANATVLPQPTGIDPIGGLPTAGVRFTFTPSPGSSWRIDDVFVDPYQRN